MLQEAVSGLPPLSTNWLDLYISISARSAELQIEFGGDGVASFAWIPL
jgi:hypothetical protein